jgi:LacI family transcriptional regulator
LFTMRDVARLARVSVATVSAVVNGKTGVRPVLVSRVQDAMKALDYHPDQVARSLKVRRTTTIGVVIPDFASGFFMEVVRGVEDTARTAGYSILLCNSNDDVAQEQRHLGVLFSRRVDGILLAPTDPNATAQRHPRPNIPIVLFDRLPPGYQGPAVVIDNSGAAYNATKYLISLGHTRIAFISGRSDLSTGVDRADGFRTAMEEAGLAVRGDYFKRGDFKSDSGYKSGLELLRLEDPPTAIFSSNSQMTLGLLKAMQELGVQCPNDMSVLGFDDLVLAEGLSFGALMKPELTVIAQPAYQIGCQAASMLLTMLASGDNVNPEERKTVKLKADLYIRGSAAAVPVSTASR